MPSTSLFRQRLLAVIETRSLARQVFDRIKSKLFSFSNGESQEQHYEKDDDENEKGEHEQSSIALNHFLSIVADFNKAISSTSSRTSAEEFIKEFSSLYFAFMSSSSFASASSSPSTEYSNRHLIPSLPTLLLKAHRNQAPNLTYLTLFTQHANMLLDSLDKTPSSEESTSSSSCASSSPILSDFANFLRASNLASDPWIRAECWAKTLESRMQSKVDELCDPFDLTEQYQNLMKWKRRVVEPFVKTLLLSAPSSSSSTLSTRQPSTCHIYLPAPAANPNYSSNDQVDQWMNYCSEYLCTAAAKTRLNTIFDDIVDFPDSRPHLLDVASCVAQQPSLLHDVARAAKSAITSRLQHAGASTANVLFLLSQTCRALCVVRPGKAAGEALIRQVCNTTIRHLRARRDAVAAVVAAITGSSNSSSSGQGGNGLHAWALPSCATDDASSNNGNEGGSKSSSSSSFDGPNILHMLLSVLTVPVIVREYCRSLAHRLLARKPQHVDIDAEKEILERLKVLLGEDALSSSAAVMLKDFETSRRWVKSFFGNPQQQQQQLQQRQQQRLLDGTSSVVVSAPCWPDAVSEGPIADSDKLKLHPSLDEYHKKVSEEFHKWKQNQSLKLLPHHGFVDLSVTQQTRQSAAIGPACGESHADSAASTTIKKSFRLNLVAASAALYLSPERSKMTMSELSEKLNISVPLLAQHIQEYTPQLFVIKAARTGGGAAAVEQATIEMQQVALSNRALMDEEDSNSRSPNESGDDRGVGGSDLLKASAGPALPAGLTQTSVGMLQQMLRSMIANTGPKTAGQIENAARVVGMFSGSSNDMRDVLSYFLQMNVICTDGSGMYKLPTAE